MKFSLPVRKNNFHFSLFCKTNLFFHILKTEVGFTKTPLIRNKCCEGDAERERKLAENALKEVAILFKSVHTPASFQLLKAAIAAYEERIVVEEYWEATACEAEERAVKAWQMWHNARAALKTFKEA